MLLSELNGFPSMDEPEGSYRRYLFTVRLWREELGAGQIEWRGRVQYANDGERRAFRDWPDLIEFLVAKLKENEHDEEL